MPRPFLAGIRALVLSFQVLAAALPGSNLALCIAADGHTAVELAHPEPSCRTDFRLHHPGEAEAHDLDRHACIDIVLSQPPFCSAPDSAAMCQPGSWLAAIPGVLGTSDAKIDVSHRRAALSPPPDPSLSARHTTVLIV